MPPGSKAIALLILLIPCLAKQGIEERRLKAREKLLKISLRKVKIDAIKRKLMDQVTFPKKKTKRVKLLKKRKPKKRKPQFRKKGNFEFITKPLPVLERFHKKIHKKEVSLPKKTFKTAKEGGEQETVKIM